MPKLWNETIEVHRREVREAVLDAAAALVAVHGPRAVTMSQIAEHAGIGRATLYKYFTGVEAILSAWHERQIKAHLDHLVQVRDQVSDTRERLAAVLEAFAFVTRESREHHDAEWADVFHHSEEITRAQHQLHHMIRDLLVEAAQAGEVREDVSPEELTRYCLHALAGASSLPSKAAVQRLVDLTLAGLRPAINPGQS
jgi:AcrR family transcriptional regulator